MFETIDIGYVAEAAKRRSRARAGGRLSDPSIKLARVAQAIQRERLEAGLPVNPLGPSENEVREHIATQGRKAKRKGSEQREGLPNTGFIHSLDFPEMDD